MSVFPEPGPVRPSRTPTDNNERVCVCVCLSVCLSVHWLCASHDQTGGVVVIWQIDIYGYAKPWRGKVMARCSQHGLYAGSSNRKFVPVGTIPTNQTSFSFHLQKHPPSKLPNLFLISDLFGQCQDAWSYFVRTAVAYLDFNLKQCLGFANGTACKRKVEGRGRGSERKRKGKKEEGKGGKGNWK